MDEERKRKNCPDCSTEMEPGYLQISEYAAFNKQRQIWSLHPDEEGEIQLTGNGFFSNHRGNFHGWICRDCGLILFDYTNNRAGMGKPVLDSLAEKVDSWFEALDRKFDKNTEPVSHPDAKSVEPESVSPKRVITSAGVQMTDEEEMR